MMETSQFDFYGSFWRSNEKHRISSSSERHALFSPCSFEIGKQLNVKIIRHERMGIQRA